MDIWDKKKRSEVMSKIRSKNTKPEILLRKALFGKGYRYRINDKRLPGKPDIVLPKYKTVIFVNGCFWHGHEECKKSILPVSNVDFWREKIHSNINRDKNNTLLLENTGWKVLTIWECELKNKALFEKTIHNLVMHLKLINHPL